MSQTSCIMCPPWYQRLAYRLVGKRARCYWCPWKDDA